MSLSPLLVDPQPACKAFVDCLTAARKRHPKRNELEATRREQEARIEWYKATLTQLAMEGLQAQLPPLLNALYQDWAIKEAVELLLHVPQGVDPDDQGLQRRFSESLIRLHQVLSSELYLHLQRGQQQRAHDWQGIASQALEQQQQWMQQQQQANQQWFEHVQQMQHQNLQANQQWANTALTGVQQAQVGLQQWYTFAAQTHQHVANMLAGTEQRQTALVEQAVHKGNVRRWMTKLTIAGLVLLGIVALWGCAFFAMLHLY